MTIRKYIPRLQTIIRPISVNSTYRVITGCHLFPAGMVLGCNRGWLPFRNSCYRIVRQGVTRTAAQTTCGRIGGKLASILDRNENNFIAGRLPKGSLACDYSLV